MIFDVAIVGAGPGGIFSAYELINSNPNLKITVIEAGNPLNKRKCPIDGKKIKLIVCSLQQIITEHIKTDEKFTFITFI